MSAISPEPKSFYKHAPFSWTHLKIFLAIILGQFTCGFTIQISGSAIAQAQHYLPVSSTWVGLIGAGTLIGLAGSLLVGKLSDHIGRRRLLMANMYVMAVISCLQLLTVNLGITLLLRILVGLTLAVEYTAGNTLLVEWLPAKNSSSLQSHLVFYWTLGFLVAYTVSSFMTKLDPASWQWMMVAPIVPGLVTALFRSTVRLPTSPTWLVNQGKSASAQHVIQHNLGHEFGLSARQKEAAQTPNEAFSWTLLLTKPYRRNTAVGGVFFAAQSFTFFGVSIFLPILVAKLGIGSDSVVGYLYNGCMILGILIGTVIFNRLTRRIFLITGFMAAAACLLLMSLWTQMPNNLELAIFLLFSIILSANLVMDNPHPAELFSASVRGTGVGLVVTLSRFGAAGGTFLLPVITTIWGVNMAMLCCGVILLVAGIFCFIFAPETRK